MKFLSRGNLSLVFGGLLWAFSTAWLFFVELKTDFLPALIFAVSGAVSIYLIATALYETVYKEQSP